MGAREGKGKGSWEERGKGKRGEVQGRGTGDEEVGERGKRDKGGRGGGGRNGI